LTIALNEVDRLRAALSEARAEALAQESRAERLNDELAEANKWIFHSESEAQRLGQEIVIAVGEKLASESARDELAGALREAERRIDRVLAGAELPTCVLCERCYEDLFAARKGARAVLSRLAPVERTP
jgi:chromosome segregation ATPase